MREQNFTLHEKLESLRIMEGMARHEAKLLWTRFMSVFYVHTAIIGIITFAYSAENKNLVLIFCAIGMILALVWLRLISLSGYYYKIWQNDANRLIQESQELKTLFPGILDPKRPRIKPRHLISLVPGVIFVGYLFILGNVLLL